MRTSLIEIEQIEQFLRREMSVGEDLVMQARILTDERLKESVAAQRKLQRLIQMRYYQNLKAELELLHENILGKPENSGFRLSIINLFKHNRK